MRLNKFLSASGVCSRRDADKIIEAGRVTINGVNITPPAPLLTGSEVVAVDGKAVKWLEHPSLWLFYKPQGLVTTHRDEQGRETVFDYLRDCGLTKRVISVGRLDLNSEGLLLITNSTEFANYAEKPNTEWKREYRVRVFGDLNNLDVGAIASGLSIDGVRYKGVEIELERTEKISKNNWLSMTLTEGKNREIRKIIEYFGLQVNRLIRVSYGPYSLGDLQLGEFKQDRLPEKFKQSTAF